MKHGLKTNSIIADPRNATLYTNRAMARLKLGLWDSVIADCEACLAHDPSSMKAHYYMSQALLAIGAHGAALQHALTAHAHCASKNDKSLGAVTAVVLRCKKEGWEHKEKLRAREAQALEREVLALLARDSSHSVDAALENGSALEADDVREEAKRKKDQIRDIFERARADAERKREVPEWAIDDISFGVMVDPVIVGFFPFHSPHVTLFFFPLFVSLCFPRLYHGFLLFPFLRESRLSVLKKVYWGNGVLPLQSSLARSTKQPQTATDSNQDQNRQILRTSFHHGTSPTAPF